MNYSEFIKFNNRAKEMRGSNGVVFIKDLYYLRKDIDDDLCRIRALVGDEVGEDDLPEETYSIEVEHIGFFGGGICETLLGTLIANVMACTNWVCNPEFLMEDDLLESVVIMPKFAPISVMINEEEGGDKALYVDVDKVRAAVCCLPELFGQSAVHDVYRKAVGNLRKYGFLTTSIEGRLLSKINKAISNELLTCTNGVEIGVLRED